MSALLSEVDLLFEGCVMDPDRWDARSIEEWASSLAATGEIDRDSARHVRRIIRVATKLHGFWMDPQVAVAPDDWRSRVDVALGARAWRPVLDLAEHILEQEGTEASFDAVSELFPVVHNQPFLDGIDYEAWRHDRLQS